VDAHSVSGVLEISKDELVRLMTKTRPLTRDEKVNLDRGCSGFVCMYQRLGLKRWPEEARGTRAYLRLENALARACPAGRENFVFVKQAWWESGKPPVRIRQRRKSRSIRLLAQSPVGTVSIRLFISHNTNVRLDQSP